jgi:hypothetical protein
MVSNSMSIFFNIANYVYLMLRGFWYLIHHCECGIWSAILLAMYTPPDAKGYGLGTMFAKCNVTFKIELNRIFNIDLNCEKYSEY